MKYALLAGAAAIALTAAQSALAADMPVRRMPVKAPPPVVAPVFSWTGCYIGGHAGYAWGRKSDWTQDGDLISVANHDVKGPLVGGQVGCNLQQDRWVIGIEGDASWANIKGDVGGIASLSRRSPDFFGFHTKGDILGTIAVRLGMTFDRSLLFGKIGAGFINEKHWLTNSPGAIVDQTDKYVRWGLALGVGWEYAFTENISGVAQYTYMNLGNDADPMCRVTNPTVCADLKLKQHIQLVKVGFNYRFNTGPVVARY